jgi:hypothetical protein
MRLLAQGDRAGAGEDVVRLVVALVDVRRALGDLHDMDIGDPAFAASHDPGLTVYWERNFAIWTAHRANVESYFSEKKELFPGRQPTLTADGLEVIFLGTGPTGGRGERFSVAKREDVQQPFNRAHEIAELAPSAPALR